MRAPRFAAGCVPQLILENLLLETKIYLPKVRCGLVPRPRLEERLNRGAELKLTLVSAPAGFGKTMLLAEWLDFSRHLTAWVSLDQSDNRRTAVLRAEELLRK